LINKKIGLENMYILIQQNNEEVKQRWQLNNLVQSANILNLNIIQCKQEVQIKDQLYFMNVKNVCTAFQLITDLVILTYFKVLNICSYNYLKKYLFIQLKTILKSWKIIYSITSQ
jgi:hypothetical protein